MLPNHWSRHLVYYYIITLLPFIIGFYDHFTTSSHLCKLRGIAFGGLNVCSLYRKIDDVNVLLHRSELNYLGLSESWLNNSVNNCELIIPGYTMSRLDRNNGMNNQGGGGLVVYTRNNYTFKHIEEYNLSNQDVEWICMGELRLEDSQIQRSG